MLLMQTPPPTNIVTWQKLEELVRSLHLQIDHQGYECIVGINRGGSIPAIMLSHRLGIPCEILSWQTRDGINRDIAKLNELTSNNAQILVVDDLVDTGLTVNQIKELAPKVDIAVLLAKTDIPAIDYVGECCYNDDRWIVFPWEQY